MPVFHLSTEPIFPSPEFAEKDGLLAVGGDLSTDRLIKAYSMGIFPWYSEGSPILWWSPDPRLVLFPDELKISRSLRQVLRKGIYKVTIDMAFDKVIKNCATIKRKGQSGTWITEDMIEAYKRLHKKGYAHSVEAWFEEELVGGLYGVVIGKVFSGESMFTLKPNASKVAFVTFVEDLRKKGFLMIDCQVTTRHIQNFGAKEIPRNEFLKLLKEALK